jgi:CTP:molybdopterin cytidylyltransferase MocA
MAGDDAADRAASMEPMRRNPSTVVVLAGSAPGEVLAAVGQSMNVTLIRPEDPAHGDSDAIAVAAAALQRHPWRGCFLTGATQPLSHSRHDDSHDQPVADN